MAEFLIEKEADENWVVSLDGVFIYVACNDGYLRTYEAATGELFNETFIGGDLDAIAIDPLDGMTLAITVGTLSSETGSGESFSAIAHVVLVDTASFNFTAYDIPVSGDGRAFGDVAFSPLPYIILTQTVEGGGTAPMTSLNLYDGTYEQYDSYQSGTFAPSLTPMGGAGAGLSLLGEIGEAGSRYDLVDGGGYDSPDSTTSYLLPEGALDYAEGVEAVSGVTGQLAIFAQGVLYLFEYDFTFVGILSQYDGFSGDIAALHFSADGNTLYALDNLAGTIVAYDLATLEPGAPLYLNELQTSVLPYGDEMVVNEDTGFAYINTTAGIVSVDVSSITAGGWDPANNDVLVGTAGDDIMDGGIGADEMTGLAGNDTYWVENVGDQVIEDIDGGHDEVVTSLKQYILPDNVEDLSIFAEYGSLAYYGESWSLTGNSLDNQMIFTLLTEGEYSMTASGRGGNDTIDASGLTSHEGSYGFWHITLHGDEGSDYLVGTADGENTLYGGADADHLVATGSGTNILDGGEGADIMDAGGTSGYTYFYVDNVDDQVITGTGVDYWNGLPTSYLYVSATSFVAPDGIYDITFTGFGIAQTITGNDGVNHFREMDSDDTAIGGEGDDYYYVTYSNPTIIEEAGGGYDRITYIGSMEFYMPLNVEEAYVYGSGGTIYGNEQDNLLITQGGTLYGGLGDDTYRAWETGTIVEYAGEGVDTVTVNYSYTLLDHFENLSWRDNSSSSGASLTGNDVANVITGSNGNETLSGLDGNDTLYADVVGSDANAIYHANDTLYGGNGNDALFAIRGNDTLYGEAGWDTLFSGAGNDTLDGGNGTDTASYANASAGVTVSLALAGAQDTLGAGVDTLVGIERLTGSNFDDTLTAAEAATTINGGDGADVITGGLNSDLLFGDEGDDVMDGGSGWDQLSGGDGNDTLTGGNGGDLFKGGWGEDTVYGGEGTDRAYLGEDADSAWGGTDADMLDGQGGDDTLYGEDGDDKLIGSSGKDALDGGADNDWLHGGGQDDTLVGGAGDDVLIGSWSTDTLTGGTGADTFLFETGHTGRWKGNADRILDFSQAEGDVIDLSAIDAVAGGEDDAFTFAGSAFTGTAGELIAYTEGGETFVAGDVNGDGVADFLIRLNGEIDLSAGDFVL